MTQLVILQILNPITRIHFNQLIVNPIIMRFHQNNLGYQLLIKVIELISLNSTINFHQNILEHLMLIEEITNLIVINCSHQRNPGFQMLIKLAEQVIHPTRNILLYRQCYILYRNLYYLN